MKELHLLSIMLLTVSSSLDNFGVGVSYGLRNICIPLSLNLFIAFVNSSGTFFSILFGKGLSDFLQSHTSGDIGAFILICVGSWIIVMEFRSRRTERPVSPASTEKTFDRKKTLFSKIYSYIDDPFAAGIMCSGRVTMKEGAILASALTLSNISTGIAAGMMGFSLTLTTAAAFTFNVLALSAGQKIGHYTGAHMIKWLSGITAGLLLIFIGIYETMG
jgi:putative sporulation protein YtaF